MYIRYKRLEVKKTICIVTEGEQLKPNIHRSENDERKKGNKSNMFDNLQTRGVGKVKNQVQQAQ
jgi:hypothetical protein